MGLDVSHDAFSGAYSAFNRFRQVVARATGGSYPPHEDGVVNPYGQPASWWWFGDGYHSKTHPGLFAFFMHDDCEGEIDPETCRLLAGEMEALLPKIADVCSPSWGHIEAAGGFVAVARKWIAGCRAAAEEGVPLVFC